MGDMKGEVVKFLSIGLVLAFVVVGMFGVNYVSAQSEECFTNVTANGTYEGELTSDCISDNGPGGVTGNRYARYYSFTLTGTSDITVHAVSSDVELALMAL